MTKHEQRKEKEKGLYCLMGGLQESARCPWQTREDFSSARQGVEFEGEGTMTYCKLIGGMLAHPPKGGEFSFQVWKKVEVSTAQACWASINIEVVL